MNSRRARNTRRRLFKKQKGRCFYCNLEMWMWPVQRARIADALGVFFKSPETAARKATLEHLKRRADGGGNETGNLVCACEACNSRRGDLPPEVWRQERWQHGI